MWRSVPQTPQAPIWISAAFFGISGQGTLWITGLAPGPEKVETRICCMPMSSRPCGRHSLNHDPEKDCSELTGSIAVGGGRLGASLVEVCNHDLGAFARKQRRD